jgi:hypothetical protein
MSHKKENKHHYWKCKGIQLQANGGGNGEYKKHVPIVGSGRAASTITAIDEHNNNNKMKCLRQRKENKTSLFEIKRQYNREQMGKGTEGNKEHVPTVGAAVT